MSLPIPNLDDRSFDDLMKEATALIPIYNKEWTNYNPSDPGITLLELFSWLCEMVIYRINQVPEENYRKYLKLLGIESARAGSGTISSTKIVLTGDGTAFNKEIKVDDFITICNQKKRVTAIISDSQLTVDTAFETDIPPGTNFTYLSAGKGTISSNGKIVNGDGTIFTSELKIGDSITVNDQNRVVMAIDSNTFLTIDSTFKPDLPPGTRFHCYKSIDSGIREGLSSLTRRYRAITAEDYENLAKECMGIQGIAGRAICVNNRDLEYRKNVTDLQPGYISVIIIPSCDEKGRSVYCSTCKSDYCINGLPTDKLKTEIKSYLNVRKLVTTRIRVVGPDFQSVKLDAWISLKDNTVSDTVANEATEKLNAYFNPIKGGKDGKGWPLGRPIYRSEIFKILEGVKGIDHVVKVIIKDSDENQNLKIGEYQLIQLDLKIFPQ